MSTPRHPPFVVRLSNHEPTVANEPRFALRVPQDERVADASLRASVEQVKT